MMAVANSTSMTRDNAAIDPELFVVGFVILSCLAAAFTDGKRAAWSCRKGTRSGRPAEGAKIACAGCSPDAVGGVKEGAKAPMP